MIIIKETVSPVQNCLNIIKKPLVQTRRPDVQKNFFFTRSLIFYWLLKFLCIGHKIIRFIIFNFNSLRGCSMHIQFCSSCIQNTPGAISASIFCSCLLIQRNGGSSELILHIQNIASCSTIGAESCMQSHFPVRYKIFFQNLIMPYIKKCRIIG